jgi:glyoxylase I family protein
MTFSHVGLTCADQDLMERFYVRHFGFTRAAVFPATHGPILMLRSGELFLELFQAREESPLPPPEKDGYPFRGFRHICFAVESVEKALAGLGNEARITMGPLELDRFIPGMKAVWIADPEGNIIELCEGAHYENQ